MAKEQQHDLCDVLKSLKWHLACGAQNEYKCSDIWRLTVRLSWLCSDWCISRQLWWGHQVPAYQVELPSSINKQDFGSVNMPLYYYLVMSFFTLSTNK